MNHTNCCEKCEGTKWPTESCVCPCHNSADQKQQTYRTPLGDQSSTTDTANETHAEEMARKFPENKTVKIHIPLKGYIPASTEELRQYLEESAPTTDTSDRYKDIRDECDRNIAALEASDTGDWRERFEELYRFSQTFPSTDYSYARDRDELKAFIEKELERARENERKDIYHYHFNAGKSEAFSLVRKMAAELKASNKKSEKWSDDYFHALTDLLSTLEGK